MKSNNNGFTLLEVMVGIGIFAIGLIGVMGISTLSLYYNAMSRQINIAQMFGQDLAIQLQNLSPDPGSNFLDPAVSDTNTANNNALGIIDVINDNPTSPAPEHNESELGIPSPRYEGITYQRFWNVADIDQNGDGVFETKAIAIIVRWKGQRNERTYHYTVVPAGLYRPPGI